ncbi:DEAD/DEAH box helicase [Actinomadura sp. ATCC 31491]|uniref:DEAD/DEAH box helicase n=1 Tax=Actinomadura luzonensis TaxID=2805427 RepID=A0ABT0FN77_9ACTN|nr:DEAD/DEAH box helicase [Actinomadura luzonensis]MCK2213361.1 DEAD/DEAH box helicase [Actinomadura luzonensis]
MTYPESAPDIRVSADDNNPCIRIEQNGIDNDAWDEIALAIGNELPAPGLPLLILPEILIRNRKTLQSILARYTIGLRPDARVRDLLIRSIEDDRAIRASLNLSQATTSPPITNDPDLNNTGPKLTRDLRPFQLRDLNRLTQLRHGANFSVPGAGKTTVTYALHDQERRRGRVNRLLVVAPLSAFDAWEEEAHSIFEPNLTIARWRGGAAPDADVVLINYQKLTGAVNPLSAWMSRRSVHLVVDEAHRAKRGATGQWGRALLALAPLAARRDILTGTPAPNHPKDLAALLQILWPNGERAIELPRRALLTDPPAEAIAAVNDVIRPLYVRTTKEELGLPDVSFKVEPVALRPIQQGIYDAMLDLYSGKFSLDRRDSAMFAQMGEVTMYLLQGASSPRLLSNTADPARAYRYPSLAIPPGSRLAKLLEDYPDHEIPAKFQRAIQIISQNAEAGKKTLVWSNFPHNLIHLEMHLGRLQPALVYGAIPSAEDAPDGLRTREREIRRFRYDPDCMVLLANPQAMSEGVSLHYVCHDAIYIDRTFNAGQYLQSLDRIHRLGLEDGITTNITILVSAGTIDVSVDNRVAEKTRRLARMLADPALVQMALPDDEEYGEPLEDLGDIEAILAHLGSAPTSPANG